MSGSAAKQVLSLTLASIMLNSKANVVPRLTGRVPRLSKDAVQFRLPVWIIDRIARKSSWRKKVQDSYRCFFREPIPVFLDDSCEKLFQWALGQFSFSKCHKKSSWLLSSVFGLKRKKGRYYLHWYKVKHGISRCYLEVENILYE